MMRTWLYSISWRWVLAIIAIGLVFGFSSVTGWLRPYEKPIFLVLLLLHGILAAIRKPSSLYRTTFVAGALGSVTGGVVQLWLWDTYAENNPGAREIVEAEGQTAVGYFLVAAPIGFVFGGVLSLLAAFLTTRFLPRETAN